MSASISILPKGTRTARLVQSLAYSMAHTTSGEPSAPVALAYAEQQDWKDTPSVVKMLDGWSTKAAVNAGTTVDATFASPLAVPGAASDIAELRRDASIAVGLRRFGARVVPINVTVPREVTAVAADWLQQNKPSPMRAGAYAGISLPPYKAISLTVLTRELARLGRSDAEAVITRSITSAVSAFIDRQLLDNTVSASANVRPASLTFGGTKITSTGSTSAQITADLAAMMAGITTSQSSLLWIGQPLTFARIALALPGALEGGRLLGIPYLANGNSPKQLTLLDVGETLVAMPDDLLDIDVARHAAVQLNDAPDDPTVASTVLRSLWQENMIGIRVSQIVSWYAPAGAVSSMVTTY